VLKPAVAALAGCPEAAQRLRPGLLGCAAGTAAAAPIPRGLSAITAAATVAGSPGALLSLRVLLAAAPHAHRWGRFRGYALAAAAFPASTAPTAPTAAAATEAVVGDVGLLAVVGEPEGGRGHGDALAHAQRAPHPKCQCHRIAATALGATALGATLVVAAAALVGEAGGADEHWDLAGATLLLAQVPRTNRALDFT